jgi:hypothetical protein
MAQDATARYVRDTIRFLAMQSARLGECTMVPGLAVPIFDAWRHAFIAQAFSCTQDARAAIALARVNNTGGHRSMSTRKGNGYHNNKCAQLIRINAHSDYPMQF